MYLGYIYVYIAFMTILLALCITKDIPTLFYLHYHLLQLFSASCALFVEDFSTKRNLNLQRSKLLDIQIFHQRTSRTHRYKPIVQTTVEKEKL